MKWALGKCRGRSHYYKTMGLLHTIVRHNDLMHTNIERCCNVPGQHMLKCEIKRSREKDQGWAENFIEIQGHRYCHDFVGYSGLRRINLIGMTRKIRYYYFSVK